MLLKKSTPLTDVCLKFQGDVGKFSGYASKFGGVDSYGNGRGLASSGETLKGWGVGFAYTKANDWFARLDYARRIGDDPNISPAAKATGRTWFMLGKIW